MDQKIKNVLGVTLAVAVLAIGYAAVNYSDSFGKSIQPSSFRSFSVTGDGKAVAIPDVAQFTFQVVTEGGKDVSATQTQNTNSANKAIDFVKSKGVADKDIKTEYYNIDPRYQTYACNQPIYYGTPTMGVSSGGSAGSGVATPSIATPPSAIVQPCPPASIVGYTVTQTVSVKIRDFTKIGDILSGIVSNGANQVGAISFTMDDPTKVQAEARADAIAKAKAQAEQIAAAGGFSLGRLLGISSGYYPTYNYGMGGDMMKSISAVAPEAAPAPTIQAGSQDVTVSMTLQYEIQ